MTEKKLITVRVYKDYTFNIDELPPTSKDFNEHFAIEKAKSDFRIEVSRGTINIFGDCIFEILKRD